MGGSEGGSEGREGVGGSEGRKEGGSGRIEEGEGGRE